MFIISRNNVAVRQGNLKVKCEPRSSGQKLREAGCFKAKESSAWRIFSMLNHPNAL